MAKGFIPRSGNNDTTVSTIGADIEKNLSTKNIIELFGEYSKILDHFERQENKGGSDIVMPGVIHTTLSLNKIIIEKVEKINDLSLLEQYKNILEGANYSPEVKARLKKILNKINAKLGIVETTDGVQENVEELLAA